MDVTLVNLFNLAIFSSALERCTIGHRHLACDRLLVPAVVFVSQWFDCHLPGCGRFTVPFPAKRRELHWLSPTT